MEPGDVIPRHFHAGQTETTFVLEGVFIDEGTAYPAGAELNAKAKTEHGPHTTETGVTLLTMFTGDVDLNDFHLATETKKTRDSLRVSVARCGAWVGSALGVENMTGTYRLHWTLRAGTDPLKYAAAIVEAFSPRFELVER